VSPRLARVTRFVRLVRFVLLFSASSWSWLYWNRASVGVGLLKSRSSWSWMLFLRSSWTWHCWNRPSVGLVADSWIRWFRESAGRWAASLIADWHQLQLEV